jgi:hypothetical protein
MERLEWTSPAGSRLVTLTYDAGAGARTVVTDLPDRGSYDWIVPDIGTTNSLVLTASFKSSSGTLLASTNSSRAATATSDPSGSFAVSVEAAGPGVVTSSPGGISCPPTCEAVFTSNESVTLSAIPAPGALFDGWRSITSNCFGTGACSLQMNAPQVVTARFYTGTPVPLYRLYSPHTFEHLYTTDFSEYTALPSCCFWNAEGTRSRIFGAAGSWAGVAGVPFYRLYNPSTFQHHWTTDLNEYNVLVSLGWSGEGFIGYILPSPASGAIPLYRLYINAHGGLHLWTMDTTERDALVHDGGWVYEGIAGYVF